MYLAFTLAALAALAIVGGRKARRALRRRRLLAGPGFAPERPFYVEGYDDVDVLVTRVRCPGCDKGRLTSLGEGHTSGPSGPLVKVRAECLRCEERTSLYFDVSGVPN